MLLGSALHVPERRPCVFTCFHKIILMRTRGAVSTGRRIVNADLHSPQKHDGPVGTEPSRREGYYREPSNVDAATTSAPIAAPSAALTMAI